MDGELRLFVTEDGADAERVDLLTGHLRRDLDQLDVDGVRPLRGGEAPPGTRASTSAVVGGLIVSLGTRPRRSALCSPPCGAGCPGARGRCGPCGSSWTVTCSSCPGVGGGAGAAHRALRQPARADQERA